MWIGDVGQRDREEIDFRSAGNTGGINFGWNCYEGSIPTPTIPPCTPPNYAPPIFDYPHAVGGGQAVVGGYVYRGSEFPSLQGYYICGDYVSRNIWLIRNSTNSGSWTVTRQSSLPSTLYTFGEAENGTLYMGGDSGIYKVAVSISLPVKLVSFTLKQGFNFNEIYWTTAGEINIREFVVEFSEDGMHFSPAGQYVPATNKNSSAYTFKHVLSQDKKIYYRLKIIDNDGQHTYSKIITTISKEPAEPLRVYPSVSNGGSIQVELNAAFHSIRIFNVYGQLIHQEFPANRTGIIYLNATAWPKGMYTLIAEKEGNQVSRKFMVQ